MCTQGYASTCISGTRLQLEFFCAIPHHKLLSISSLFQFREDLTGEDRPVLQDDILKGINLKHQVQFWSANTMYNAMDYHSGNSIDCVKRPVLLRLASPSIGSHAHRLLASPHPLDWPAPPTPSLRLPTRTCESLYPAPDCVAHFPSFRKFLHLRFRPRSNSLYP